MNPDYKISWEIRDGICRLHFAGSFQVEKLLGDAGKVAERLKASAGMPVLFDICELQGDISVTDRFRIGEAIVATVPPGAPCALLCRPDQTTRERFFESVIVNRGLEFRHFVDEARAVAWLRPNPTAQ
ncbi:MAG: hypothetical protein ACHQ5A_06845 [Opitutales bacterium]